MKSKTHDYLQSWILLFTRENIESMTINYLKWVSSELSCFTDPYIYQSPDIKYIRKAKVKHCFFNAQSTALQDENYKYYEGWYVTQFGIPLQHGFLVRDNLVFDPTALRFGIEVNEWAGIHIPTELIREYWENNEGNCMSLNEYYLDHGRLCQPARG